MPSNKLFSLFDEKLRRPGELVATPPQNLDSIGNDVVDTNAVLKRIRQFENVRLKVDYSDFANFVFFNSALDYFNITGEKVLNEFPYDGTAEQEQDFDDALDDYQRYVAGVWPRSDKGHLKFQPTSGFAHVLVDDVGLDGGTTKTSLMSPGTGSITLEFWSVPPPALTGSNHAMVVAQKVTGSGDGFTAFFSGSSLFFSVTSGSTTDQVSVAANPGSLTYFCFSYDRSDTLPLLQAFTGSAATFPVRVTGVTGSISGEVGAGPARFAVGSGSLTAKSVRALTGSLDDLRFWKSARTLAQLSSTFNTRIVAQDDLFGLWRFNESGSVPLTTSDESRIVRDHSGHRLHGRVQGYFSGFRASGSLLPFDQDDLIISLDAPEVSSYIAEQQASASAYDRPNDNLITRMLPEQFFLLEEFKNTNVLQNFLYILARQFDQIKVGIDQFAHVLRSDYGRFNQTPDALLQDVARFFGWEFTGNFLNADVVQYIVGKQVLANTQANKALDVKLFEIKNEFWKRTLINLMHLYKTKGTRESVESLLRIYGVNRSFIRLKEYGFKPNAGIQTFRIVADKSVAALTFGSGSAMATNRVDSKNFRSRTRSVEARVRFPTEVSVGLTSSLTTGSIWTVSTASNGAQLQQLFFTKSAATSLTGSLHYTGSEGHVVLSDVPIFDNRWYNLVVNRDYLSSSLVIDVRLLDRDEVVYHATSSQFVVLPAAFQSQSLRVGSSGTMGSQYWMQEVRVWDEPLSDVEMQDHVLNFQSFGTEEVNGLADLRLHWRLNENVSADTSGLLFNQVYDFSGNGVSGSGTGFMTSVNPYRKFLNEYNYIASPELGWTEEKIRSIDGSSVTPADAFVDNPLIGLEFNLVDALNEDISQIISTLDGFNESVGAPVNRFRDSYPDLDILRTNYFKRLQGSVNFRVFADLLEFFDRSFIDMVRRLIPARAVFLGDEFVVESHMLERPKMQWNYRRREPEFQPEGVIKVYIRT